jgi:WD40 repeat protein
LAAVWSQQATLAAVPAALLTETIKIVGLLAAGETAEAGLISTGVSALVKGVLHTMTLAKQKAAGVLLILAALVMGGIVTYHTLPDQPSKLVEPPKGQELMLLEGHTGPVLAVTISPDGKVLASAGADGLRTWALPGGEPLTTPARDAGPVNGLAFSPDGKLLALACGNGVVKLLDGATMKKTSDLKGHIGAVLTVAFHPDGGHLASGGADGTIKLWTINGGGDPITCKNPGWMRGPVRGLSFSAEPGDLPPPLRGLPRILAAAGGADKGRAGWLGLWNAQTGEVIPSAKNATAALLVMDLGEGDTRGLAVAFDPHGFVLASAGKAKGVSVTGRLYWSMLATPDGSTVRQLDDGYGEGVYAIAFSRDRRRVISAGADGVLKIWNIPEFDDPAVIKRISIDSLRITRSGHTGPVRCVAVSPDGALLATGGDDYTVRVWSLPAPQPLRFIPSGPSRHPSPPPAPPPAGKGGGWGKGGKGGKRSTY